jgi:hypothetical protein
MSELQQGGVVTPGHLAAWSVNGVLQDAGTATEPLTNSLGLYGNGGTPLGITNSAYPWPFGGAYTTMGFGVSQTAAYVNVYGSQSLPFEIITGGTVALSLSASGTMALSSPLGTASGGTGLTATPANGQIPIGNGSGYSLSTLTAGNGVTITNGAGSVTISAPQTGGSVLSVTAGTGLLANGVPGAGITTIGTLAVAPTSVSAGAYGGASSVPTLAVNAQGQLVSATSVPISLDGGTF